MDALYYATTLTLLAEYCSPVHSLTRKYKLVLLFPSVVSCGGATLAVRTCEKHVQWRAIQSYAGSARQLARHAHAHVQLSGGWLGHYDRGKFIKRWFVVKDCFLLCYNAREDVNNPRDGQRTGVLTRTCTRAICPILPHTQPPDPQTLNLNQGGASCCHSWARCSHTKRPGMPYEYVLEHTHTHTDTHACMHIRTCMHTLCAHTHTHTHTHTPKSEARAITHTRARARAHTHTHTHASIDPKPLLFLPL
jgi:hypothetical protein